jgi:hypothetical protein
VELHRVDKVFSCCLSYAYGWSLLMVAFFEDDGGDDGGDAAGFNFLLPLPPALPWSKLCRLVVLLLLDCGGFLCV